MAVKKHTDKHLSFEWKHFEGDITLWLVRWYRCYALSYKDLTEMAAESSLASASAPELTTTLVANCNTSCTILSPPIAIILWYNANLQPG